jgi:hypothetical protein
MREATSLQEHALSSISPLTYIAIYTRFIDGKYKGVACCLPRLIIISMRVRLTSRGKRIATDKASVASQLRSPA